MQYPKALHPNSTHLFEIDDHQYAVPKCQPSFSKAPSGLLTHTFGRKPVLLFDQQPMFAELVILKHLVQDGWVVRWVEPYGKPDMHPIYLTEWRDLPYKEQTNNPFEDDCIENMLQKIAVLNGNKFGGCWDVVAKKGEQVLFAESKRKSNDRINQNQVNWLKASLAYGLNTENFLVVEWMNLS